MQRRWLLGLSLVAAGCSAQVDDTTLYTDTGSDSDTGDPIVYDTPTTFGLHVFAAYDAGTDTFRSYEVDFDLNDGADGTIRDIEFLLTLSTWDGTGSAVGFFENMLCTVVAAQPGPATPTDLGDPDMVLAFKLDWDEAVVTFRAANGQPTEQCGNLDPSLWGDDLATGLATVDWGFGLTGEVGEDVPVFPGDEGFMFGARFWLSTEGAMLGAGDSEIHWAEATELDLSRDPPRLVFDDQDEDGIWDQEERSPRLEAPTTPGEWDAWTPQTARWYVRAPILSSRDDETGEILPFHDTFVVQDR